MGLVHSHQLLTQPVTLNRMRYVCQRNSKLPKELQHFNIELLANDLNKLGFNIQLRDKRGNPLSSDKICNEIYMSRPDVEGICMVNNGKVNSSNVTELAKYFNKHYGTNIPLTVNPMDPSSPKRSIPEVCDDLYLVSDKINRRLTDDVQGVKKKLFESIDQLKTQQRVLDESFGKHIASLKRVGHPEFGNSYDTLAKRVQDAEGIRSAMIGELGRQIVYTTNVSQNLGAHLDSRFYPHIRQVQGVLSKYYHTPYDGSMRNIMMQTNNIVGALKPLSVATEQCNSALKKLDLSLKDYDENNQQKWADLVNAAYTHVKNTPGQTQPELEKAFEAYKILLTQPGPGVCRDTLEKSNAFRAQMKTSSACDTLNPGECQNNQWCRSTADGRCEFNDAIPEFTNLKGGGNERSAFWVDAADDEESQLF